MDSLLSLLCHILPFLCNIAAGAQTKQYTLNLVSKNISPDGFNRAASLVNGEFPGPLITANKGENIKVTVNNHLTDPTMRRSTSIHWHGIFQHQNTEDDGAAFISQCPIGPGNSYTYLVETAAQAGTFWYHSHLSTQYIDGVRGPLIIYDPQDPHKNLYDVDDASTVVTLADWWHGPAPELFAAFESPENTGTPEPFPDGHLINGKGRFGSGANVGPAVDRARINVTKGKRYRLRLVSMAAESTFEFSIQKHPLTVIELDGINYKPYPVDTVTLIPGQRASVVINANQAVDNYWITGNATVGNMLSFPFDPNYNGSDMLAVLHYSGASNSEPKGPAPIFRDANAKQFMEFEAQPLENLPVPGGCGNPDQVFNFNFTLLDSLGKGWAVNGKQFKPPTLPILLQILSQGFTTDSQFNISENAFVVQPNSNLEIQITGVLGTHPIHTHGHAATIITSASGGGRNCQNPPVRDVIPSGATGSPSIVRINTNNPGAWFVHCHIDWHLEAGLAAVMIEDPKDLQRTLKPNQAWENLCKAYNALPPELQ